MPPHGALGSSSRLRGRGVGSKAAPPLALLDGGRAGEEAEEAEEQERSAADVTRREQAEELCQTPGPRSEAQQVQPAACLPPLRPACRCAGCAAAVATR
jgi:hypothetical protein